MADDNTRGKIDDGQIQSVFHLREIDAVSGEPLTYLVYGVKDVHHLSNGTEINRPLRERVPRAPHRGQAIGCEPGRALDCGLQRTPDRRRAPRPHPECAGCHSGQWSRCKTREASDGSQQSRRLRRCSRSRQQVIRAEARAQSRASRTEEGVRYFLAKEGSSLEKPELGAEVASEGEALIKAFQSKNGVIYTVLAYKAEAEMQGGSPTLVKRPLRK